MRIKLLLPGLVLGLFVISACKKDSNITCDGSTPTWDGEMATFISASCNSSGCHNAGAGIGDFTSYAGIQPYLSNGTFEKEVMTKRTMPEGSTLSDADLTKVQCWIDNGYAEN